MQIRKTKIDNFIIAIGITVVIAYFFPQLAQQKYGTVMNSISSIGISLIFFFYGLKLSLPQLVSGLKNWRLHALIQTTTFLVFPLMVILFYPFIEKSGVTFDIWLGFLFLAALPSTVSSSVVMVSIAKGNLPAAIFNASISGLIGIAITPLWMGIFLDNGTSDYTMSSIYQKLLIEILLPVVVGLLLQPLLGGIVKKHVRYLTLFDKSIILLIIYKSFAESFLEQVFSTTSGWSLIFIFSCVIILFYIVFQIIGWLSLKLEFSYPDQTTAQFCGTKKSLVHGTVFLKTIFTQGTHFGVILLPLMLFHAVQILITSVIAEKRGRETSS